MSNRIFRGRIREDGLGLDGVDEVPKDLLMDGLFLADPFAALTVQMLHIRSGDLLKPCSPLGSANGPGVMGAGEIDL
jgi:hypothetical protein